MSVSLKKISSGEKAIYLAYDQGLEHGPKEFNNDNVDPLSIISLAKTGNYNGIIFQKGIAEKYNSEIRKSKVPLIIKLNGKTSLFKGDPISRQLCTVEEAIKLGASAVGYTIYPGSIHESIMLQEFEKIQREAHAKNIPVIAWIYPRGKNVKENDDDLMIYSARIGLELGADIVKIKYSGNLKALKWAVRAAGKCKIVVAGGIKTKEEKFLREVREVAKSGAFGLAVGRNVWKNKNPDLVTRKIRKIVFE